MNKSNLSDFIVRAQFPEIIEKIRQSDNAVIEASAGTGKTYTLQNLFIELLSGDGVRPGVPIEQLVLVTFTEKAVQELKGRCHGQLTRIIRFFDEAQKQVKEEGLQKGWVWSEAKGWQNAADVVSSESAEKTNKCPYEFCVVNRAGACPRGAGQGCHCWNFDGWRQKRLRAAQDSFDAAGICTIHAFCKKALSEEAFSRGALFEEEVADEKQLFRRVFRQCLRKDFPASDAAWALDLWLLSEKGGLESSARSGFHGDSSLERILTEVAHGGRPARSLESLRSLLVGDFCGQLERALEACQSANDLAARFRRLAKLLPPEGQTAPWLLRYFYGRAFPKNDCPEAWKAETAEGEAEIARTIEGLPDFEQVKTLQKEAEDAAGAPARELANLLSLFLSCVPLSWKSCCVSALFPVFDGALRREKRARGLMVFNDMLTRLRDALRGTAEGEVSPVAQSLADRCRCILVDEFQDTDQVQWAVFRELLNCRNPPRLMLIGDPKQSIYRFRGADLPTYEDARALLSDAQQGRGQRLNLDTNYRTSRRLVDVFNALFDPEGTAPRESGGGQAGRIPLLVQNLVRPEDGQPVDFCEAASWTADRWKDANLLGRSASWRIVEPRGGERIQYRETRGGFVPAGDDDGGQSARQRLMTHAQYGSPIVAAGKSAGTGIFCGTKGGIREAAPLCLFQVRTTAPANKGKSKVNQALANLTAAEIHRLTRPDSPMRIDVDGQDVRPIRRGDIFVLVRDSYGAAPILMKALKSLGIPCSFKNEAVWNGEAAQEIRDVLAAVADPYDRALVHRAALTPFFGYDAVGLAEADEAECAEEIRSHLIRWSLFAQKADYAAMFEDMKGVSGLERRQIFAGDARRLADTEQVFDLLLDAIGTRALTAAEVLAIVDSFMAQRTGDEDGSDAGKVRCLDAPSVSDDGGRPEAPDVVQILTMHKSKGLEAPIVFVLDDVTAAPKVKNGVLRRSGGQVLVDDGGALKGDVKKIAEGIAARNEEVAPADSFHNGGTASTFVLEEIADAERLVYVAMTRAAVRLYLPVITPNSACGSSWDRINYRLGKELRPVEGIDEPFPALADGPLLQVQPPDFDAKTALSGLEEFVRAIPGRDAAAWSDGGGRSLVLTSYSQLAHGAGSGVLRAVSSGPEGDAALIGLADEESGRGADRDDMEGREDAAPSSADSSLDEDALPAPDGSVSADPLPGGAAVGTFVHALFEKLPADVLEAHRDDASALAGDRTFLRLADAELKTAGVELDEAQRTRAAQMVLNALCAPLPIGIGGQEMALLDLMTSAEDAFVHEMEFLFPIPDADSLPFDELAQAMAKSGGVWNGRGAETGFVKGFVDVTFTGPDGRLWFGDWKTDRLRDVSPEGIRQHFEENYAIQARLYTLALVRALAIADEADFGRRFGGFVYFFVRSMDGRTPAGTYVVSPTFHEVKAWEEALRQADFSALRRGGARHGHA